MFFSFSKPTWKSFLLKWDKKKAFKEPTETPLIKSKFVFSNIEFDFVPQLISDLCNKNILVVFNTIIDLQKFCNNLKEKFIISEDIKIIKCLI